MSQFVIRQSTERRPVVLYSIEAVVGGGNDYRYRLSFSSAQGGLPEHDRLVVGPVPLLAGRVQILQLENVSRPFNPIRRRRIYPRSIGMGRRHVRRPR